jgi:hypothetical protein
MYTMTARDYNILAQQGRALIGDRSDDRSLAHKGEETQDVRLMLPPPPRHCPHGTVVVRPPSAAHGWETCARTVRDPGARWLGKFNGTVCAGLL